MQLQSQSNLNVNTLISNVDTLAKGEVKLFAYISVLIYWVDLIPPQIKLELENDFINFIQNSWLLYLFCKILAFSFNFLFSFTVADNLYDDILYYYLKDIFSDR